MCCSLLVSVGMCACVGSGLGADLEIALERQELSRTYLAQHGLESNFDIIVTVSISINIVTITITTVSVTIGVVQKHSSPHQVQPSKAWSPQSISSSRPTCTPSSSTPAPTKMKRTRTRPQTLRRRPGKPRRRASRLGCLSRPLRSGSST